MQFTQIHHKNQNLHLNIFTSSMHLKALTSTTKPYTFIKKNSVVKATITTAKPQQYSLPQILDEEKEKKKKNIIIIIQRTTHNSKRNTYIRNGCLNQKKLFLSFSFTI